MFRQAEDTRKSLRGAGSLKPCKLRELIIEQNADDFVYAVWDDKDEENAECLI